MGGDQILFVFAHGLRVTQVVIRMEQPVELYSQVRPLNLAKHDRLDLRKTGAKRRAIHVHVVGCRGPNGLPSRYRGGAFNIPDPQKDVQHVSV